MDFQKMVEYRNDHNPYARRLGILVQEIRCGYARVTKTITKEDLNPVERPHGGVYFSLADTACGSAVISRGYAAVTLNANFNFFRSANLGDILTAEAQEVKNGATICVYETQVKNQDGVLLGGGTFTFYKLDQPIGLCEESN